MQGIYINTQVWHYLQSQPSKIAAKILEALDYDIAQFVQYGNSIEIERTYSGAVIPDYIFNYITKHEHKILATLEAGF